MGLETFVYMFELHGNSINFTNGRKKIQHDSEKPHLLCSGTFFKTQHVCIKYIFVHGHVNASKAEAKKYVQSFNL